MHCKYSSVNAESQQEHLITNHEEYVILHTMAKQVDTLSDSSSSLDNFKSEVFSTLRAILENQNIMRQELFLVRNNTNTNGSQTRDEPAPAGPSPQAPEQPCPPPSSAGSNASTHTSGTQAPPPPRATIPPQDESTKILYIGDSISHNVNMDALEAASEAQFVKAKAYSSDHDTVANVAKHAAKFPESNFTKVIPTELKKGKYKHLIIQSGSVDITNLNTKEEPSKYTEYFKQETIKSANNIFNAARNALKEQPTLKKVVLMKQIPRYDPSHVDPMGLKPTLSMLFNSTVTSLWMDSPDKDKIFIGNHDIECTGAIKESRYRETKSGKYDGIHLYGSSGRKSYTMSVLNILKAANITSAEYNSLQSGTQFLHRVQNRRNGRNSRQTTRPGNQKQNNAQQFYSVPTQNRFSRLPQGNC